MRRRAIEIEVVLLDIFAMVSFPWSKTERPFLQNGILAVPQRDAEHQELIPVADRRHAVFAPAVRFAACHIVRKEVPGLPVRAVVLAHRSPGALGNVRSPLPP